MVHALWKILWRFLKTLNMEFPYDPTILLGINSREVKPIIQGSTCTVMFMSALFTIVKR